jgi:hypothetical protein
VKVKLYIEGGGDGATLNASFREGWNYFFSNAGIQRGKLTVIRGKGRTRTFDLYQTALRTRREGELPLLLVDSEDLVAGGQDEWSHLKARDDWDKPEAAGDCDAFLMIVCMETWFLADREALRKFFHDCWRDNALPQWANLETVSKSDVLEKLAQATAACGKKSYAKGKLSFELLKVVDPAKVEEKCPGAKRLLDRLRSLQQH